MIHVINRSDVFQMGVLGKLVTIASIPINKTRASGIAIQDVETLDHVILVLQQARVALYGDPEKPAFHKSKKPAKKQAKKR